MILRRIVPTVSLLLLTLALPDGCSRRSSSPVQAAVRPQANETGRATSTPYTGDLSVFETPGREQRLQIERVMDLLKIKRGRSVVDIGAGSGWFTVRAAKRVGPGGVVYAEDISPASIRYIEERAAKERLGNIHTLLGSATDPSLPDEAVDAVMMLKMYHEVARPRELLHNLRRSLRPGGLIGLIDRNGNGSGTDHGIREETIVREMEGEGFKEIGRYDFVKADGEDYFLIFQEK